ncbi:MAG TPA: hypothetical protein VN950_05120 [Terriglobales bacterium]|nr:hypothetical protein [Terriglobales bacterium]
MRDTRYAKENLTARLTLGDGSEARIENIFVKATGQDEIRFSWWKNENIVPRALDLNEGDLLQLLERGIAAGIFSNTFRDSLRQVL